MTAMVIDHPKAGTARGLSNARQMVREAEGVFRDDDVLFACEFLKLYGDWMDYQIAEKVEQAIHRKTVAAMNREARESLAHLSNARFATLLTMIVLSLWAAAAILFALLSK